MNSIPPLQASKTVNRRAPDSARKTPKRPRSAVIGAGPGGLATSMLLAKSGVEVDLFEKATNVGGRTSAFGEDGYRFDLGPTFFMYPQVLEEIFRVCGFDLHKEIPMKRLDPQYRIDFASGGFIDATPNIEQMEAQIAKFSPEDAPALRRFLDDNRRKLEAFKPILQRPFHGWRDVLDPSLAKLLPLLRPQRSLDNDLGSLFKDPRIRLAFSFQSKYLGMSPFRCPSLFSILSFLEYEYGVYHPIGGCAAVSEKMAELATRLGVRIHTGEAVEKLEFSGRKVTGVHTAKRSERYDAITINADFAHAMRHLVPDKLRRRWKNKKIAKKKFSCSTFMLYLGVDGSFEHVPHHTIHIAKDYRDNLDQIENRKVLPSDPSFYVQNACVSDPSLAPDGKSTLYVLVPVPHQTANINWATDMAAYREKVLDLLPKIGIEGVRDRIEYERVITPDDWQSEHSIHMGATFNLAHTFKQMLHLRPRNRFEDLESVYLVGGGTHPGSGLPVIFESARMSSNLLLNDLGIAPATNDSPSPTSHERTPAFSGAAQPA